MNLAKNLLDISKSGLVAAKCLYENELYPQAVFYFQQSVEKATKAFGLLIGIISKDELKGRKGIGHNPLKIYKRVVDEQLERIKRFKKVFEILPLKEINSIKTINIEKICDGLENFIKFYKAIIEENPVFISRDEIERIIKELERLEMEMQESRKDIHFLTISEDEIDRQSYLKLLNTLHVYSKKIKKENLEQILNLKVIEVVKLIQRLVDNVLYVALSLFYFSIITFPHAVITRYPEESNPLEIYNKEHPLIQLFEKCFVIIDKTLKKIELSWLDDMLGFRP